MESHKLLLPHLNTQTNSNLSFSFLTIPQLIELALKNKLTHLAIADYHPYEIVDFFNACKINKIKPIWGVKIFLREQPDDRKYSATIYPHNNKGYKEILQKIFSPDSPNDRVFSLQHVLSNLSENCLIVFEAQRLEEIIYIGEQWILTHSPKKEGAPKNLFIGFNFFLLSPSQNIPQELISFLIPFFSIKYLNPNEEKILFLWKKTNFDRYFFANDVQDKSCSYLNPDGYFSHCTDDKTFYQLLIVQWQTFLARINLNPSFNSEKINKTKKENLLLSLKGKCLQKLIFLKKDKEENYQKTLEKELSVIEKLNYSEYFLTFSDIVNHLRERKIIVGPGRGSSVSSLVVYLLGITSVDPLENNLFFERFLNEKRNNLPDIDLDVENQEEVFSYLQKKYPKKQVSRIITKKKIGWKNALQESAKLYKIDDSKLKEIASLFGENPNFEDLRIKRWQMSYPNLFQLVNKIQNLYYDTGIHPAGIIISPSSLIGLIPLRSENDYFLSLFEEENLAKLGLKKYDFLSLRETLGFIREAKEILQINLPDYQELNLKDEKTWELLKNFLLTGIFQLDTPSARILFNRFRPQNFSELIIFLSLNRPGTRKRAEEISQKKFSKTKKTFFSSPIEQILAETYENIIFEEQISQILAYVYSCSFADAEVKRREIIANGLEEDFLNKSQKKMTKIESDLIYQQINSSLAYTFNKSHAVAYGYLVYYISYLKANFFPQLITHLLNKKKDKELAYLQEAFFYGFQIEGPDINYSELEWFNKDKSLFMGFSNLKDYKSDFFQKVIEERKRNGIFKNWEDFINRIINHWKNIDDNCFENWVKSNLFKSLQVDSNSLLNQKRDFFRYLSIRRRLIAVNNNLQFLDLTPVKISEDNVLAINQKEFESLGFYISYFSRWQKLISQKTNGISSLLDIFQSAESNDNKKETINVYAIICNLEKKDEKSCIITLQDIRNSFKLIISADLYLTNKDNLAIHNELLFTLKVELKQGKINSLACEKMISL
ncbi:MAG: Error-prone DNA polymerase [Mycoplasmataceae bacterium]|nr:MAG: Error-prone DNA polymerase [Mycoplasmataceae bacterium]